MLGRKVFHPGAPIAAFTADDYRDIVRELRRLANLHVCAPLTLTEFPQGGRVIGLDRPETFVATLSGSSSPYNWTEALHQAGNTWVAGSRSGTSNAYEVNGVAGLGGQRVWLEGTAAGDWRFQFVRLGTAAYSWTFNVTGCNSNAVSGAVVTLKQGGITIASCTTSSLGSCSVSVPAGSYSSTVTASGYATYTHTASINTTKVTSISLTNDTSHQCNSCGNCPAPNTLYISDSLGMHTLTWNGGASSWSSGAISFTSPDTVFFNSGTNCWDLGGTGDTLTYTLTCNSGAWTLQASWLAVQLTLTDTCGAFPSGRYYRGPVGSSLIVSATASSTTCNPFSLSFNLPTEAAGAPANDPGGITPGGAGTLAVTP